MSFVTISSTVDLSCLEKKKGKMNITKMYIGEYFKKMITGQRSKCVMGMDASYDPLKYTKDRENICIHT